MIKAKTPDQTRDYISETLKGLDHDAFMMKHLAPTWLGLGRYAVRLIDVDLGNMDAGDRHYILTYYPSFLSDTKGEENDLVWRSLVAASEERKSK